ncbi:hypothetical protein ACO2Q3_22610 [Caulobacter sp. KR2-114]|uniref:hypothetical protein n=1 Tax=Caulobacter sp. KR2-114 TaxID=3400912 RepID=UPI003BFBC7AD
MTSHACSPPSLDIAARHWIQQWKALGGTFHVLPADPGRIWLGRNLNRDQQLDDLHRQLTGVLKDRVIVLALSEIAARAPSDIVAEPQVYLKPRRGQ